MRIGGFQKVSLIDYPGKVAAVVFTQGCNFRCSFCHNVNLVLPSCFDALLSEKDIINFLKKRIGKLQGVVITGGEPTLQFDLEDFIQNVKDLGFLIKLDTNGSRPEVLQQLIKDKLLDYIAMDIKAPIERYREVVGVNVNPENIHQSIDLVRTSGLEYQFRTTFPKPLLQEKDISGILSLIDGDSHFQLQPFVPQETILDDSLLDKAHYNDDEFDCLRVAGKSFIHADCSH